MERGESADQFFKNEIKRSEKEKAKKARRKTKK